MRPPLAAALWPMVRPLRDRTERARDGRKLLRGITAVIAARNEEYSIRFCLDSLVGFVDQVVCIDNGSEDSTVEEIRSFTEAHGDTVAVDLVSMPGALLGDCREEGLRRTRHQWHLRWDADMIARTTGPDSILKIREEVLANDRPRSIQMSRINLIGDLRHTPILGGVVDVGESWLMRFSRSIKYTELQGKYDVVRPPLYYTHRVEPGRHIFHLAGLKSDENLMHRFHYFAWRERVNREGRGLDPELRDLESYKRRMNQELFGTSDPCSVKWRYQRQLSYHMARYEPERYGEYPEPLRRELEGPERFEVLYRDGRPWIRVDHADPEMQAYEPTAEDLAWDPEAFLRRFLDEGDLRALGVGSPTAAGLPA